MSQLWHVKIFFTFFVDKVESARRDSSKNFTLNVDKDLLVAPTNSAVFNQLELVSLSVPYCSGYAAKQQKKKQKNNWNKEPVVSMQLFYHFNCFWLRIYCCTLKLSVHLMPPLS